MPEPDPRPGDAPLPAVSAVIPTRNRAGTLPRAIDSALGQTVPPVEVVVVLDGPQPETSQLVEERYRGRPVVLAVLPSASGDAGARPGPAARRSPPPTPCPSGGRSVATNDGSPPRRATPCGPPSRTLLDARPPALP